MNINEIYERYDAILKPIQPQVICMSDPGTSYAHLRWMLSELMKGEMESGKANRWLGFVQGIMVERRLIKVSEERDFTRPYFQNEK